VDDDEIKFVKVFHGQNILTHMKKIKKKKK